MKRALRIAVVGACPYPVPQGSQVYLRETARALQRAGHEVRLVVYGYGIGEDTSGLPIVRAKSIGRRTKAGPSLAKPLLDALLVRTLRRVCRAEAIDVVSAHNYEGLLVALAAGTRPIVYHAHNAMQDELPHYFGGAGWARRFGAWLDRRLPRRADACIAPHARLRDYLVECGCDLKTIAVIPPSIDPVCDAAVSERVELAPVLYTGNLDAYQNLPLLAEAMRRVRATVPEARLTIISADPLRGTSFDNEPWVNHVASADPDALRAALAQDAVFACPRVSWSGFPMKLLNAMSAGQAIVCCAGSAHPLSHQADALVTPDGDPDAFADALLTFLRDAPLRETLGAAARAAFLCNHGPETFAAQLDKAFHAAVNARSVPVFRVV